MTFRNFALNRYDQTEHLKVEVPLAGDKYNYAGFFRILRGDYADGYAYLRLTADEYSEADGAECVVLQDEHYKEEFDKDGSVYDPTERENPNHYWEFARWDDYKKSWGNRSLQFGKRKSDQAGVRFLGELEEEADGIVKVTIPANDSDAYYTLQGVKVSQPTKGVYIHNGKKVIVK